MTPERMAEWVMRWVRFYTRHLPAPIAERRLGEIDADLHEHVAHERATGLDDRKIARNVASRMLRGIGADLAWRTRQPKTNPPLVRAAVRVVLGVTLILSLPAVAMLITDEVVWSLADFVLAGALLTVIAVALELAARKAGNLALAVGVAGLGAAAGVLGKADDAPGLVLLGILLVASGCALGVRRARASRGR